MASASRKSVNVKDVSSEAFVKAYAAHLKKSGTIELPKWVDTVKTGTHRALAPIDPDWFYIRAASVARKVYLRPGTGVVGLTHVYGGASQSGVRKSHHCRSAHGLIRNIMKQLETQGLMQSHPNGGRSLTSKGRKELDLIAATVV